MKPTDLNRRDFNKLTVAAFGGIVAGTAIGCGGDDDGGGGAAGTGGGSPTGGAPAPAGSGTTAETGGAADEATALLMEEPHVCRGLNACKSLGKQKDNDCAGLSTCATAAAHTCAGHNDCKGQGGCGETVGQNSCKGQGKCEVPLMDEAWKTAQAALKKALEAKGKKLNDAPAKAEG